MLVQELQGSEIDSDVLSLDNYEDESVEGIPYANRFMKFIDEATTRYHAVDIVRRELIAAGYEELREGEDWTHRLSREGKYLVTRNSSSLVAFAIGKKFNPTFNSGFSIIASHIDSLCLRLKPVSKKTKSGLELLGVAPYSVGGRSKSWDASFSLWWNRDLAIGGRVMVRDKDGAIRQELMKSSTPIAVIPSSGKGTDKGPFNYETQMVPIIGLVQPKEDMSSQGSWLGERHSARLLQCVADGLPGDVNPSDILDFDLELYDIQPSTLLGLDSPPALLSTPRMDDKMCAFSAYQALLNATRHSSGSLSKSGDVAVVYLSDNEEIGSNLRQGAKSNFLDSVLERITEIFANGGGKEVLQPISYPPSPISNESSAPKNIFAQTMARSFLLSADVANGLNPGFVDNEIYVEGLAPALNKGVVISKDRDGGMTTEPWAFVLGTRIAERVGQEVQLFENRSDVGGGGTIGPMISQRLGCPAMDVGMPMLSMHSIRGICGSRDPQIGVEFFESFLRNWEEFRGDTDFS